MFEAIDNTLEVIVVLIVAIANNQNGMVNDEVLWVVISARIKVLKKV